MSPQWASVLNGRVSGGWEPVSLALDVGCLLVPTTANSCVPISTPARVVVIAVTGCARCCRTIVCTPMHSTIDASDAHRGQWTANSGVRSIK